MEEVKKENLTNVDNDSKNKNTYNWGLDIIRVVATQLLQDDSIFSMGNGASYDSRSAFL